MNRREFLQSSVVGASVAAGVGALSLPVLGQPSADPKLNEKQADKAKLRLSSQLGRLPGKPLKEKVENLLKYGGEGIEVGPGDCTNPQRVQEIKDLMGQLQFKVSAVCAADGPYIVPDEAARKSKIENAKRIMTGAAELGSTGVIMVPAFNGAKDQLVGREAHKVLVDVLKEIGEHGAKVGCPILLEPLNRGEAWFLRQVEYAAAICREVNSPGVALMGDFFHMRIEETSDMAAFISAGPLLRHVHLASWDRNLPGQDKRSFVDGFRGLKWIGYQGFCSLECGCKGNPEEEIPKSFAFLKKQWEEAVV